MAGDDERLRQVAAPAQPRQRAAIARAVTVHDVHALTRQGIGETASERSEAVELERYEREPGVARQARQHAVAPAADENAMATAGQAFAQCLNQECGSGGVRSVRHLQHRQRTVGRLHHLAPGSSVPVASMWRYTRTYASAITRCVKWRSACAR